MRGATGLQMRRSEVFARYVDAVFEAMWVARRNLGDAGEVAAMLSAAGIGPEAFMALA